MRIVKLVFVLFGSIHIFTCAFWRVKVSIHPAVLGTIVFLLLSGRGKGGLRGGLHELAHSSIPGTIGCVPKIASALLRLYSIMLPCQAKSFHGTRDNHSIKKIFQV
jgi:hypothetical protein